MTRRLAGLAATVLLLALLTAPGAEAAGLLLPRDGGPLIAVRSHRVDAEMHDGLARTTLRQTFVNPGDRAVEGIYVFPLPEGAALVSVAMETGGKRFEGLLVERQKARQLYDAIVREKRDPALVEQIGRNLFRLSVFPVLPKVDTVVELTWISIVPLEENRYRYVYPLSGAGGHAQTEQDFTFRLKVRSSFPLGKVESVTPSMEILRPGPREVVAAVEAMRADLEQDVVVEVALAKDRPDFAVSTFRGEKGDGWFLATLSPTGNAEREPHPRDVTLLLDASGSMRGEKFRQARAAALLLLGKTWPEDRVNVIRCGSYAEPFAEEPVPATPENLAKMSSFIEGMEARGGTALADALRHAAEPTGMRHRNRIVVLLTDGLATVGAAGAAKLSALARSGARRGHRFFCLGFGYDADASSLGALCRSSGGKAEMIREGEDVEDRIATFLDRTSAPSITNVKFSVFGLETYDRLPRIVAPACLGDQVILCGRYRGGGLHVAGVTANVGGAVRSFAAQVVFRQKPGGVGAIAWLFAREKLDHLEALLRLRSGLTDEDWYATIGEGGYETEDAIISEILAISREYGVQSAYTSFIVLLPEDRRRLDPRNLRELAAALERARKARAAIAPGGDAPRMSMSEIVDGGDAPTDSGPGTPAGGGHAKGPSGQTPPGPAGGYIGGNVGGASAPRDPSENWMDWWAVNREEFLSRGPGTLEPVLEGQIETRVEPVLLRILDDPTLPSRMRRAAVIALARCPDSGKHFDRIARLLDPEVEKDDQVAQSAALALCLLPDSERERALMVLQGFLSGRVFRSCVEAGAAIAAGILGDRSRETWRRLRFLVAERDYNTSACALFAIGLIGDEAPVPHLLEWLGEDRSRGWRYPWFGRARIIDALGRIGDPRALPAVLQILDEKDTGLKREAMNSLGRLTSIADPGHRLRITRLIIRHLQREPDDRTRQQGLVALGRIAATSSEAPKLLTLVTSFLEDRFQKGDRAIDRPYAALALGLAGRSLPPERAAWRARIAKRLRNELERRKGDRVVLGAVAVALGMVGGGSGKASDVLREIALDRSLPGPLRVGAVAGLGVIGSPEGLETIRSVLVPHGDRDVRAEAAFVLSRHGDEIAAQSLRAMLKSKDIGVIEKSRIMRTLGRFRDPRALDDLLAVVDIKEAVPLHPTLSRAAAVEALGHLVDWRGIGRIRQVVEGCDHTAFVWGIADLMDMFFF